ncbi:MAG: ferritin-like domain-containing protein [Mariprofundaceae bacterium]
MQNNLFSLVRTAFCASDVDQKILLIHRAAAFLSSTQKLSLEHFGEPMDVYAPGRPENPGLVSPRKLKNRGFGTKKGRAVMMHAIAHIEFNAMNLALDAVQRFPDMPEQFYQDWLQVAVEESYHFELIRAHLRHLGGEYGDYAAHDGLWEMCEKTADDVLIRMALVPRVLEARGLDVTPGIQDKLAQAGDHNAVSLLDIILRDEIGHVRIGNHWFRYCCKQRSLDPTSTFMDLLETYYPKGLSAPFNLIAREQAGFSRDEMALLMR